jgi:hypothetical protein
MYKSLEQRMAQSYLDLFPAFIPDQDAEVGVLEQEEFYLLMKKLYELAYDEPSLFVPVLHEDDAYPTRYKTGYGKPALQDFVLSKTKKCNQCRYCVQTDKTGTRPLAYVKVSRDGNSYALCPYFPGYRFCFTSLDGETADKIIERLDFMDGFAK